jgi:FecR protein
MKILRALRSMILVAIASLVVLPVAFGQDQDPPGRVARLNYTSGSVSFQPGGEGDWLTAVTNRPLTTGDNLWTDQNSRAELHIGSTAIRMASETSVTFLELDDQTTQLRLSIGSIIVRLRHIDDDDRVEVDTPNLAFSIQRPGEYRFDVNADGTVTTTTVWQGRGEATGGGYSYTVVAGQIARFTGTDELDHDILALAPSDDFDRWCFSRDQREDHVESANYISPEVTGYEDLDDYGHWHYAAGYGTVWTPAAVADNWAPYRYGHWVWVAPWGWTWVEDEPWGFAPFHYGRWAYVSNAWCWVPGPVVVRPVYAPALVAFVGGGGFHLSVSIGGGTGVAWFPLAPGEVYVPPYRVSPRYVNNVNITNTTVNVTRVTNVYNYYVNNNTTNVTRITYVNQHAPSAITVVSHDTFVNARPVARNVVQVDTRQVAEAPVSHVVEAQPVRESVLGTGRPSAIKPPAAVVERHVVATRMPPAPRPSFEQGAATPDMRAAQQPTRPAPQPEPFREASRTEEPKQVPRPPSVNQQQRSEPVPREGQSYQGQAPHPLVRTAPPPQPRPEQDQQEEAKFRAWQEQSQKAPAPEPNRHAPEQHREGNSKQSR